MHTRVLALYMFNVAQSVSRELQGKTELITGFEEPREASQPIKGSVPHGMESPSLGGLSNEDPARLGACERPQTNSRRNWIDPC